MQKKSKVSEKAEINLLLSKAQKGDDQAFSELLSMYEPLLLSMAAKYLIEYDAREDREDLIQELRVAFFSAVRGYEAEKSEVEFGFFAKICMRNALVSRIRSKKGHGVEILSIDEVSELRSSDEPDTYLLELESEDEVRRLIDENLSEYEKRVWILYLEGKTPKAIGDLLSRDAKSISNALSRIRAKLRAAVGEKNT
ncbi:MAG: sigma-70 family RNA polymerase sigma factor [Ruminococcaceae bacterium]|nr:sigma-70 family RNA polymerase sigma factor [Oscillospiraceae bacterium]